MTVPEWPEPQNNPDGRREKDGQNNQNDRTTKRSGGMADDHTNDQRNGRKGQKEITMVVVGWQPNNDR